MEKHQSSDGERLFWVCGASKQSLQKNKEGQPLISVRICIAGLLPGVHGLKLKLANVKFIM